MRAKLEGSQYTCLEDFEKDFKLVWHNATIYNQKDTIYYKAAIRIKEAGERRDEEGVMGVVIVLRSCSFYLGVRTFASSCNFLLQEETLTKITVSTPVQETVSFEFSRFEGLYNMAIYGVLISA